MPELKHDLKSLDGFAGHIQEAEGYTDHPGGRCSLRPGSWAGGCAVWQAESPIRFPDAHLDALQLRCGMQLQAL